MNSEAARNRLLSYLKKNPGKHTAAELCKTLRLNSPHQVGRYCGQLNGIGRYQPTHSHIGGDIQYWYEEEAQ